MAEEGTSIPNDVLVRLFPLDLAHLLIEFNKYIAALDADYIILMARKALRLYDLLTLAGGPYSRRPVLSHHVLDQDLKIFCGKKVCLVDDTLILGTTLGEAERSLTKSGANVTTHVFAVDRDNWCQDLISPTKIITRLNHQSIRSFCAMEVSALSATGIPYLSDFPVSEYSFLTPSQLMSLHSLPGWEAHTLTTPIQEDSQVAVYSLLPKRDTEDHFRSLLGGGMADLLEITKVRAFCRRVRNGYWVRYVPIVTLGPLREEGVTTLFDQSVARLEGAIQNKLYKVRDHLASPLSQLRFVQYVVSLIIGNTCLTEVLQVTQQRKTTQFDATEAARLFGPWLRAQFQFVHTAVPLVFAREARGMRFKIDAAQRAALPRGVFQTSKSEFEEFTTRSFLGREAGPSIAPRHFTDLVRAFIGLYRKYEPPARTEARKLGQKLFEAAPTEAPYRDRLKYGFAWRTLIECLLGHENLSFTKRRSNIISLILDHLVDMGIAVPILCQRDGVMFRGYRYGEDVEFGDQEVALAFELIESFAKSSGRDAMGRIVIEKLLAGLLHVGVAKKFLRVVTHGLSGIDGIARIGFHLHGAVVDRPRYDTIFADEQDTWMSGYLIEQGVLTYEGRKKTPYRVGSRPEAAFPDSTSLNEARQLGGLIGTLFGAKDTAGRNVLSSDDLIVLTACAQPRYAVASVAAELRLFARWFENTKKGLDLGFSSEQPEHLKTTLQQLVTGTGYTALNSARLKLSGYKQDRPARIVSHCCTYLKTLTNGNFLASQWESDWGPVLGGASDEQRSQFDPMLTAIATDIVCSAANIFSIEIALQTMLGNVVPSEATKRLRPVNEKVRSYLSTLRPYTDLDEEQEALIAEIEMRAAENNRQYDAVGAITAAQEWLLANCPRMKAATAQAETIVNEFGRTDKRTSFHSVIWYDIIDSRGKKSNLAGQTLVDYRARIRAFKDTISRDLMGLVRSARDMRAVVFPFQGTLSSKDDEKHIFMGGTANVRIIQQTVKMLLMRAGTHGICIRVLAIRTGFAGEPGVYKFETDPEPRGEVFWEHSAELKSKLKAIEQSTHINAKGVGATQSFFWVAGDLIGGIPLPRNLVLQRYSHQIETEVENLIVSTRVDGGPTNWPRT